MENSKPSSTGHHYRGEYAKLYLDRTLTDPYTVNKSKLLANLASKFGVHRVLDLGSNVHGSVKMEGSVRFQMNKKNIDYVGVDLSFEYFDSQFIKDQGISEKKVYPQIKGVVGDILKLPVKSNSTEMAICCDVLEHTSDPVRALREISRIMKPEGVALIILPSLYKLDIADFSYIKEKRKSSHLEKETVDEWMSMCEQGNLEIDEENSLAIGVASGLSYLSWIDEQFVPERRNLKDSTTYSKESMLHRDAKNILSKYDEVIDLKIYSEGIDLVLLEYLKQGDFKNVFKILRDAIYEIVTDKIELGVLQSFFNEVDSMEYTEECIETIRNIFLNSKFPRLLLGNSALLVLRKEDNLSVSRKLFELADREGIEKKAVKLVIRKGNRVLMLKRARAESFPGIYELPGGGLNENEDIFSGGGRELFEETGLTTEEFIGQPESIDFITSSDHKKCREYIIFILVEEKDIVLNPAEHSEYKWVSAEEVDNLDMFPETKEMVKKLF